MASQRPAAAGIWGVGTYLPPTIRTNDWWDKDVANSWLSKDAKLVPEKGKERFEPESEGQRLVLAAMAEYRNDPFYGAVERRILDDDLDASQMEIEAAKAAIRAADIDPGAIDMLLGFSILPDYQLSLNACTVHHALGLSRNCVAMSTDSVCNSFLHQLSLAEAMIRAGRARYALLLQSNIVRRIVPSDWPSSAWFGDAATAVIVGPVSEGFGLLATSHRVEGSTNTALVASVPGARWYDEGRVLLHPRDPKVARSIILHVADHGKEVVTDALDQAGFEPSQVDFYASHQATSWFRPLTQKFIGMSKARFADTHAVAAHASACNIPLALHAGLHNGSLRNSDVVATYSGGTGLTWSSVVLRWGRG